MHWLIHMLLHISGDCFAPAVLCLVTLSHPVNLMSPNLTHWEVIKLCVQTGVFPWVCVLIYEVPQWVWTLPLSDLQASLSLCRCSLFSVSFSFTLGEWRDLKAHNGTVEPALPVGHQCVCVCFIRQCLDIHVCDCNIWSFFLWGE